MQGRDQRGELLLFDVLQLGDLQDSYNSTNSTQTVDEGQSRPSAARACELSERRFR
jgi:hypothetical protein